MQKESWLNLFRRAILAGIAIGIGGAVFLACENKVVGACFFSVGLFMVVTRQMALYTGMVGYLTENCSVDYVLRLLVTLAGNWVGTALVGYGVRVTRQAAALGEKAEQMCAVKTGDSMLSLFVLAVFCGILMYAAVHGYRSFGDPLTKVLGIFLCVPTFILAGFEHCVADMFYFSAANVWSVHTVVCLLVMIVGNGVGGVLIPLLRPKK